MEEAENRGARMAPRGFFPVMAAMGPGIVLAGGVVGSGELINTPIQAAKFGFILLWAVIIACLIKYFLQVEIGRHCIVHNRSVFEAMNITPGPRIFRTSWIVWVFLASWTIVQVGSAGIVGAIAGVIHGMAPLDAWFAGNGWLTETNSVQCWAVVVTLLAALLMWRAAYHRFEKIIFVLVIGFSITVLVGVGMLQETDYRITSGDISQGFSFSLGENSSGAAFAVIALMGGLGVSGIELLIYPYWIREKGFSDFLGSVDSPEWVDRGARLDSRYAVGCRCGYSLGDRGHRGVFFCWVLRFFIDREPNRKELLSSIRFRRSSREPTVPGHVACFCSERFALCSRRSCVGRLPTEEFILISSAVWGWLTEVVPQP